MTVTITTAVALSAQMLPHTLPPHIESTPADCVVGSSVIGITDSDEELALAAIPNGSRAGVERS